MNLRDRLASEAGMRSQLERLSAAGRRASNERLYHPGEPSFAHLALRAPAFSRRLARELRRGGYHPAPVTLRVARLDKLRELCVFAGPDRVVQNLLAEILTGRMEPHLPDSLHSYRHGRSSWTATRQFAAFIRAHRRDRPDPRRRGLHVLRADVAAYGDSIPMHDGAPVWTKLWAVLGIDESSDDARLVRALVRPAVAGAGAVVQRPDRGVATGSPVATALTNLYLIDLDRDLEAVCGAYYARYGDDMLFAHEDLAVVEAARDRMVSHLRTLGLEINAAKEKLAFFNGAGRCSPHRADVRGTTGVRYLGCRIDFNGVVGLSNEKCDEVIREITDRVRRTTAVLRAGSVAERAGTLSAVVNASLDPHCAGALRWSSALRGAVTDREQLATLDLRIARVIAESLSGRRGRRAFRDVSYRALRVRYGLESLVVVRNRRERRSGGADS